MEPPSIPPFRPLRALRGAHAQTLAAAYLPGPRLVESAEQHRVHLADGDQIVLHEDCPNGWRPAGPMALLMHGLAGCHQSRYMQRIAAKLCQRGVRVFRMDHRGCGAGVGLSRLPYHGGSSDDVAAAIEYIETLAPDAALSLVGFSLSGNIVLKLLGQRGADLPRSVKSAIVVCPPVDLSASCDRMLMFPNQFYDRHFVRLLMRQVRHKQQCREDVPRIKFHGRIRRLRDFDEQYTAPLVGFSGADDYYAKCSARSLLPSITVPTMILASRDDPMIPIAAIERAKLSSSTLPVFTDHGGHLGFLARSNGDEDRHWMDWRVVEWVLGGEACTLSGQPEPAARSGSL